MTGSFQPPAMTGSFQPPSELPSQYQNLTGQFSIEMLQRGPQPDAAPGAPAPAARGEVTTDMRARYGIWGGVAGAALGALLGVINASLEGVPLERGLQPLMLMTIGFMVIMSIMCAAYPRVFEQLLQQIGLLSD
jgi:hypothetical protein